MSIQKHATLFIATLALSCQALAVRPMVSPRYHRMHRFHRVPWNPVFKPSHESLLLQNAEIDRLKKEDISDEELKMIRTRAKANLLRGLDDNEGLASSLALYQALYGDWRELFHQVENLDKVSKADIRRVANQTFVPTNRTVGIIETISPPQAAAQNGGGQ
jgi:hypothetical protein